LNVSTVDELSPYIYDIQVAIGNYPNMPADYHGTALIKKWVDFFRSKSAMDRLTEEELR
jgi:hypothetical protein